MFFCFSASTINTTILTREKKNKTTKQQVYSSLNTLTYMYICLSFSFFFCGGDGEQKKQSELLKCKIIEFLTIKECHRNIKWAPTNLPPLALTKFNNGSKCFPLIGCVKFPSFTSIWIQIFCSNFDPQLIFTRQNEETSVYSQKQVQHPKASFKRQTDASISLS